MSPAADVPAPGSAAVHDHGAAGQASEETITSAGRTRRPFSV
jgi:hypothetical protein